MNKWFFAKNINGTNGSGIINVSTQDLLCLCDEENANIILRSLEPQKKYYFISFTKTFSKHSLYVKSTIVFLNKVIDVSPMEFIEKESLLDGDFKTAIVSAIEISKDQFEKYKDSPSLS